MFAATFSDIEKHSLLTIKEKLKMEVTITTENFESLKNGEKPLVVDFWATWCGPCRAIAPYIEELAKEYDGKIVVGKCDVEENDDIVMEFGVRNIPTILFFKNGEVVDRLVGGQSKSAIQKKFEALL
ncbi:thioredoxin [uncultured Prevotella sp.]|uniref:thioredoxin n=2 Tax=uncultured Prevotella sp. TaxID=159272 RepID=UPI00260D58B6|nr:thioredoxin [uncultured Prevotella sp.]